MKLARLAQELPAGDERLQDDVAQVRVVVQELPQGVGRHLVDFAIAPGDGADDRRAAGQLRHVAGELPGPVDRDGLRRLAGFVHDLDLARLDDEELEVAVADLEELFPVPVPLELRQGAAPQRGHLGLVELGEGDGTAGRARPCLNLLRRATLLLHLAKVRHGLLRHVHLRLIDVAPGPALAGLEGRDHRVGRVVEMLRGVAARRAVAAADVAAGQAEAQMDPGRAQLSGTLHTPSPGRNGSRPTTC